jgi:ribulose 1,5-bisphosphate synthetase/thiazole synthase
MPSHGDVASRHDVVVIGAGPAGEAAAELGGSLGYPVTLVERDMAGGTVVTSGGAPTTTFREAAAYLSAFEKEKAYGVALMACHTRACTYGCKLAATAARARLHPGILRAMRLPSLADWISRLQEPA